MRATPLLLIASACLAVAVPVGPNAAHPPTSDSNGNGVHTNGQPNGNTPARKAPIFVGPPDTESERKTLSPCLSQLRTDVLALGSHLLNVMILKKADQMCLKIEFNILVGKCAGELV